MKLIDKDKIYQKAMDIIQDKAGWKEFAIANAIAMAETIESEPVKHGRWIKSSKHKWELNSDGTINTFAWGVGHCNGPVCTLCGYSPCEHCDPEWAKDEDCHELHFECSECGAFTENSNDNFCPNCGAKMDGGTDNA